jgi:hypothetical protein
MILGQHFCTVFAEYGMLNGTVKINTWEECNKYDLTTIHCFWLANYND